MKTTQLQIVKDHLLVELRDGSTALMDTGCPTTRPCYPIVSEAVGRQVDWLWGVDHMQKPLTLDWRGQTLTVDAVPEGEPVRLFSERRVPSIDVYVGKRTWPVRAILDTAAPLSYMPKWARPERDPDDWFRDFHPFVKGWWWSPVWTLGCRVGERVFPCRFGIIPDAHVKQVWEGWLVGSDFFRDATITLDLKRGELWQKAA